jgi:hypothetical protein
VDEVLELLEESSVAPSAAPTVDTRAPRLDGAILRGLGSESALARYRRSQPYSRGGTPPDLEPGGNAEPGGQVAHWQPQGPRWIRGGSELGVEPSSGPSLLQRVFTYGIGQAEEAARAVASVAERRHAAAMEQASLAAQRELTEVVGAARASHEVQMLGLAEAADAALAGQALGTEHGMRLLRATTEAVKRRPSTKLGANTRLAFRR